MAHRLFIAIRPPANLRDLLIDTMEAVEGARWQDEDQLHLTLRFVGEVETPLANDVAAALGRIEMRSFDLAVSGVGYFERKGSPTSLWAALTPSAQLRLLQKKVETACQRSGLAPETRRYHPHITLARLNRSSGGIGEWIAAHSRLAGGPFRVERFALYESELTRGGSIYRAVAQYSLHGPAAE